MQPTLEDCFEDLGEDSSEAFETNKMLSICIYTDPGCSMVRALRKSRSHVGHVAAEPAAWAWLPAGRACRSGARRFRSLGVLISQIQLAGVPALLSGEICTRDFV